METIKKYWSHIAAFVLFCLLLFTCNGGSHLETESASWRKKADSLQVAADVNLHAAQLSSDNAEKHRDTVRLLREKYNVLRSENSDLQKRKSQAVAVVKKFTADDIENYLKRKYDPDGAISTAGKNTVIADTISRKIVGDLVAGDYCGTEVNLLSRQIDNLEAQSVQQDSAYADLSSANKDLLTVVKFKDAAYELEAEALKNAEAAAKRARRQNLGWKILIPVALVGGFLLGN